MEFLGILSRDPWKLFHDRTQCLGTSALDDTVLRNTVLTASWWASPFLPRISPTWRWFRRDYRCIDPPRWTCALECPSPSALWTSQSGSRGRQPHSPASVEWYLRWEGARTANIFYFSVEHRVWTREMATHLLQSINCSHGKTPSKAVVLKEGSRDPWVLNWSLQVCKL